MKKSLIVFTIFFIALSSCYYVNGRHVSGNGVLGTEQREITGFTGVETHGSIDIIASQGSYNVKVETDQNLLQYIETRVENGRLMVRFKNGISITHFNSAKVHVSAPGLDAFETHGSGNISSQGRIADKTKIDIGISGSGDVRLDLDCPEIKADIHGSGDITLSGETRNLVAKTSGSGDIKAANLKAETAKVSIHGNGYTEVFASEALEVEVSGSGDVHYKGEPKINTTVHGSGSVSKMN